MSVPDVKFMMEYISRELVGWTITSGIFDLPVILQHCQIMSAHYALRPQRPPCLALRVHDPLRHENFGQLGKPSQTAYLFLHDDF